MRIRHWVALVAVVAGMTAFVGCGEKKPETNKMGDGKMGDVKMK